MRLDLGTSKIEVLANKSQFFPGKSGFFCLGSSAGVIAFAGLGSRAHTGSQAPRIGNANFEIAVVWYP